MGELVFIVTCIFMGMGICFYVDKIKDEKTARIVSKIYLVLTFAFFATAFLMCLFAKTDDSLKAEMCGWCGGDGIGVNGKKCPVCSGAGGAIISSTHYSIPVIYPICIALLGIGTLISRVRIKQFIAYLESKNNTGNNLSAVSSKGSDPQYKTLWASANTIQVKLLGTNSSAGETNEILSVGMKFIFTDDKTGVVLGEGVQNQVITLSMDHATKIRCHLAEGIEDAFLYYYYPRNNAKYKAFYDVDNKELVFESTDSF